MNYYMNLEEFTKKEYEIGKWAIEYINKTFNVNFLIDEAGFIAMHIINANYRESTNKSVSNYEYIKSNYLI